MPDRMFYPDCNHTRKKSGGSDCSVVIIKHRSSVTDQSLSVRLLQQVAAFCSKYCNFDILILQRAELEGTWVVAHEAFIGNIYKTIINSSGLYFLFCFVFKIMVIPIGNTRKELTYKFIKDVSDLRRQLCIYFYQCCICHGQETG